VRRAGGDQIIPRPAVWHLGGPALWADLVLPEALSVEQVVTALRARGPAHPAELELEGARSSAVLIALYDGARGAEVVLTRRTRHVSTHKGEVSFPGGRMDPGETPVQTALREAHEEVGLDPSVPEVVGELDHLSTVASRSHIVPVVARLPERPTLVPARAEVARLLHVPLVDLLEPGTYHEERWGAPPLDRSVYFFDLDDETVWGATARMLAQLLGVALGVER
jgi:8-oxo-dGTP pyrophosphatase MutT (NUDIX family)